MRDTPCLANTCQALVPGPQDVAVKGPWPQQASCPLQWGIVVQGDRLVDQTEVPANHALTLGCGRLGAVPFEEEVWALHGQL